MGERNLFYEQLERQSDGDYVKVVRCKDCKHQEVYCYETRGKKYFSYNCELAENNSHVCLDDDFCSRGERREK